jgi:redox-sensitive bicupin YhaK (pirin superfamily)
MEIISYVLDGTLNHRDSTGIRSDIHAGNVQLLRAGHGVRHSDFNASTTAPLHFLQIWIIPDTTGLEPSQQELTLDWSRIRGRLHLIASPAGTGNTLRIHQDVRLYVGYFDADQTAQLDVADDRLLYVHTARGALQVNGTRFTAGDGLTLQHPTQLRLTDASAAEVLVFDMLGSFHAHRRA